MVEGMNENVALFKQNRMDVFVLLFSVTEA